MRRYRIGETNWFARVALGVMTVLIPAAAFARSARHGLEPGWLAVPPMLFYLWYMSLTPIREALLSDAGEITFVNALRKRTVRISEIVQIRPMFNLGSGNFVLTHGQGSEYLFGDPSAVATLVRDLRALGASFAARGVPEPPGTVV